MKSFFRGIMLFGFGLIAGGAFVAAAFSFHVVRAEDGWHWAKNPRSHMTACYADVRNWTANDWSDHPQLAAALVEAGEEELVIRSSADGLLDELLGGRAGTAGQAHRK